MINISQIWILTLAKHYLSLVYNDENKVNPILKDRMYRIHTAGYGRKGKNNNC